MEKKVDGNLLALLVSPIDDRLEFAFLSSDYELQSNKTRYSK